MDEFKAASGRVVKPQSDGSIRFDHANGYLAPQAAFDAEEYFRAKRDEELGRWRWPINPDVVAQELNGALVRIWNERTGNYSDYKTQDGTRFSVGKRGFDGAAAAYFEAHPAPKPWHDAQAGEFWTITHAGEDETCRVDDENGTLRFVGVSGWDTSVSMPITHHSITTAVRMVAEAAA